MEILFVDIGSSCGMSKSNDMLSDIAQQMWSSMCSASSASLANLLRRFGFCMVVFLGCARSRRAAAVSVQLRPAAILNPSLKRANPSFRDVVEDDVQPYAVEEARALRGR
jgi:hypothetical protein